MYQSQYIRVNFWHYASLDVDASMWVYQHLSKCNLLMWMYQYLTISVYFFDILQLWTWMYQCGCINAHLLDTISERALSFDTLLGFQHLHYSKTLEQYLQFTRCKSRAPLEKHFKCHCVLFNLPQRVYWLPRWIQ